MTENLLQFLAFESNNDFLEWQQTHPQAEIIECHPWVFAAGDRPGVWFTYYPINISEWADLADLDDDDDEDQLGGEA